MCFVNKGMEGKGMEGKDPEGVCNSAHTIHMTYCESMGLENAFKLT